jgi:uncharacterized protein YceH (UPF0502 family)
MSVITEAITRHCPGCDKDLPVSAFYASTGHRGECKECRKARSKAAYANRDDPRNLKVRVTQLEAEVAQLRQLLAS